MTRLLRQPLLWITLGAALVRLIPLLDQPVVLTEGTTYVTIAHNLLAGHGYIGILGGREPFVPPLYPWLIAAGAAITGQGVTSARLVSWLAGVALVPATFWLGDQLFDRRSGLWAALLVASTPLLIEYSSLEWSETLYTLLLVVGLALGWQARRTRRWQIAALAGLSLGAAYLTRIEGALAVGIVALWLLLAPYPGRKHRWQLTAALLGTFVLVALPYIVWLSGALNRPAWESKSALNFVIAQRMVAGVSYVDAAYGLDEAGHPTGVFLERSARLVENLPAPADQVDWLARLQLLRAGAGQVWLELRLYLLSPLMLLAVAAGVAITLWTSSRRRGWHWSSLYLGSFVVPALWVITLVPQVYTRYLMPLLPLWLVWAGVTLASVQSDLTTWLVRHSDRSREQTLRWIGLTAACAIAIVLLWSLPRSSTVTARRVADVDQQRAGVWLAQHAGQSQPRILAVHSQVPFYADGIHVPMPDGTPAQVVAYAEDQDVDVIVTSPRKLASRPRLAAWRSGAELPTPWRIVYRDDQATGGPLLLWEK